MDNEHLLEIGINSELSSAGNKHDVKDLLITHAQGCGNNLGSTSMVIYGIGVKNTLPIKQYPCKHYLTNLAQSQKEKLIITWSRIQQSEVSINHIKLVEVEVENKVMHNDVNKDSEQVWQANLTVLEHGTELFKLSECKLQDY